MLKVRNKKTGDTFWVKRKDIMDGSNKIYCFAEPVLDLGPGCHNLSSGGTVIFACFGRNPKDPPSRLFLKEVLEIKQTDERYGKK